MKRQAQPLPMAWLALCLAGRGVAIALRLLVLGVAALLVRSSWLVAGVTASDLLHADRRMP